MVKLSFEIREKESTKLPVRRNVLFFIVVGLSAYMSLWIVARGWQGAKAGINLNWFHEVLGIIFLIGWCVWCYKALYQNSEIFLKVKAEKEQLEKQEKEAQRTEEIEKRNKVFNKFIQVYQSAQTFADQNAALVDLLRVGLESPILRQKVIDLIAMENEWMREVSGYLCGQSLMSWRIKNTLFETSGSFNIDAETQDKSIKIINMCESIIKRHLIDYDSGITSQGLNLGGKVIPTLSLGAVKIPEGALHFDQGVFWQGSFSEGEIINTSFIKADLRGVSFWKTKLVNTDMTEALLSQSKLRTDLQRVKNLTSAQFFMSKDWELSFLSRAQVDSFFPTQEEGHKDWDKWVASAAKRDRLYFNKSQIDKIKV